MTSVPSERRTRGSEDDTSQEKEETDGTARVISVFYFQSVHINNISITFTINSLWNLHVIF